MNKVNIKGRKKLSNAQMLKILKLYRESKKNKETQKENEDIKNDRKS